VNVCLQIINKGSSVLTGRVIGVDGWSRGACLLTQGVSTGLVLKSQAARTNYVVFLTIATWFCIHRGIVKILSARICSRKGNDGFCIIGHSTIRLYV
jgi:hypothetical protein